MVVRECELADADALQDKLVNFLASGIDGSAR